VEGQLSIIKGEVESSILSHSTIQTPYFIEKPTHKDPHLAFVLDFVLIFVLKTLGQKLGQNRHEATESCLHKTAWH